MRYVHMGNYEVSIMLLLIVTVIVPIVSAATYYMWAKRTTQLSVDEPLSIIDYPSSIHVHPGENKTLDVTIQNSAVITYSAVLVFAINDTAYQNSYVTFSNDTYRITPSTNNIKAWMAVNSKAPPAWLELQIEFYRE